VFQNHRDSLQQDLQVKTKRPVVDILQVEFQPTLERQVAAAGYLPQACQSRLDAEPPALDAPVEEIDIADGHRARPDKAHLAAQDIEQLRQFVDAGLADEAADSGYTRIVGHLEYRSFRFVEVLYLCQARLGVDMHRAELIHREKMFSQANPLLDKKYRSRRVDLDGDGDNKEQRQQQRHGTTGQNNIEDPLDKQLIFILGHRLHCQEGNPPDMGKAHPRHLDIEDIGHEAQGYALFLAGDDDRLDIIEHRTGNGNDDFIDHVFFQTIADIVDRAEKRPAIGITFPAVRVRIDEADNLDTERTTFL